ncbi:MAG TPA: MBL fold metallo-hydrolase [Vicinamibacterales bacterium]|nr:MBL fold metallo-hydrolase [Vicinamibacterales bacterium]
MRKTAIGLAFAAVLSTGVSAQDAAGTIAAVKKAMGAEALTSITYSGAAATGNFGQSKNIAGPLAMTAIAGYRRTLDLSQPSSRAIGTTMPPAAAGGPPPQPGTFNQGIAPTATWPQQVEIWLTPWGFLQGAAANNATARAQRIDGKPFTALTWSPSQKAPSGQPYRVIGYVNDRQMIERVETWIEHPVMGDLHVEQSYSDYRDVNGVKVPGRIVQKRGGMQTFEATVNEAIANPPNLADLLQPPTAGGGRAGGPGGAPAGPPAPPAVQSEKLADGVFRITGGYVALAVELRNEVVVLEGGQNEARGLAVIGETKRLFPSKPIRYVVNTHAHFDHASGLAPFAADGVTIITHTNNAAFLARALGNARTLAGDALAKSRRKPMVEGAGDKRVLTDGARTIELHHVKDLEHSDGMLIAFLPKERILFTGDFNVPAAGQPVSPAIRTLVDNTERLKLDFERHVTVHAPNPDRPLTKADLLALLKGGS